MHKKPDVKLLNRSLYLVCGKVDHPLGTEIEAISLKQSINQSINQLFLNTVNGSPSWFSDMPCNNYNL